MLNPNFFDNDRITILGKSENKFMVFVYKEDTFVLGIKNHHHMSIDTGSFRYNCTVRFKFVDGDEQKEVFGEHQDCYMWRFYRDFMDL